MLAGGFNAQNAAGGAVEGKTAFSSVVVAEEGREGRQRREPLVR